jgi:hypothetical protein
MELHACNICKKYRGVSEKNASDSVSWWLDAAIITVAVLSCANVSWFLVPSVFTKKVSDPRTVKYCAARGNPLKRSSKGSNSFSSIRDLSSDFFINSKVKISSHWCYYIQLIFTNLTETEIVFPSRTSFLISARRPPFLFPSGDLLFHFHPRPIFMRFSRCAVFLYFF